MSSEGGCKVFVGNLDDNVGKTDLQQEFEKFGSVRDIYIVSGYGFVTFTDPASANEAIRGLDGVEVRGLKLRVEMSRDKPRRDFGSSRGRGGGRGGYSDRGRGSYGGGGRGYGGDRPRRSASPRGYRDSFQGPRDRSPGRFRAGPRPDSFGYRDRGEPRDRGFDRPGSSRRPFDSFDDFRGGGAPPPPRYRSRSPSDRFRSYGRERPSPPRAGGGFGGGLGRGRSPPPSRGYGDGFRGDRDRAFGSRRSPPRGGYGGRDRSPPPRGQGGFRGGTYASERSSGGFGGGGGGGYRRDNFSGRPRM